MSHDIINTPDQLDMLLNLQCGFTEFLQAAYLNCYVPIAKCGPPEQRTEWYIRSLQEFIQNHPSLLNWAEMVGDHEYIYPYIKDQHTAFTWAMSYGTHLDHMRPLIQSEWYAVKWIERYPEDRHVMYPFIKSEDQLLAYAKQYPDDIAAIGLYITREWSLFQLGLLAVKNTPVLRDIADIIQQEEFLMELLEHDPSLVDRLRPRIRTSANALRWAMKYPEDRAVMIDYINKSLHAYQWTTKWPEDRALMRDRVTDSQWAYHWAMKYPEDRAVMIDRVIEPDVAFSWINNIGDVEVMYQRVTNPQFAFLLSTMYPQYQHHLIRHIKTPEDSLIWATAYPNDRLELIDNIMNIKDCKSWCAMFPDDVLYMGSRVADAPDFIEFVAEFGYREGLSRYVTTQDNIEAWVAKWPEDHAYFKSRVQSSDAVSWLHRWPEDFDAVYPNIQGDDLKLIVAVHAGRVDVINTLTGDMAMKVRALLQ